ncbi:hypothetical protein SAMN05444350_102210 [Bacteroides stercorirosoris]|uniref:Uncharacterized protein n=1 Tax=Bacteroides stercorirosoris TaxID=871324 RepID=A0A1M6B706_9BACE|nr:hypothetical protein SAMN05444350_102210 [Bacteroides stercorirosoris]
MNFFHSPIRIEENRQNVLIRKTPKKLKSRGLSFFWRKRKYLPFSFTNFAICNPQNRDEDRDNNI